MSLSVLSNCFRRRSCASLCEALISAVGLAHLAGAQTIPSKGPANRPAFEVISIRGHKPGYWPTFDRMQFTADGLTWMNAQPQSQITYAYDLRDPALQVGLIPGAPKWIRSEWFDIQARLSDSDIEKMRNMTPQERETFQRQLVQSLLADRFKFEAHIVPKEALAYELVVAKGGPKNMKPAASGESDGINTIDSGDLQYRGTSLAPLLLILPQMVEDCPIIDKTGLTGKYDFELKWERDPSTWKHTGANSIPQAPTDGSRPSIFKALEEELGLKLVPIKAPRKTIVIDHIERPSPN